MEGIKKVKTALRKLILGYVCQIIKVSIAHTHVISLDLKKLLPFHQIESDSALNHLRIIKIISRSRSQELTRVSIHQNCPSHVSYVHNPDNQQQE
jgi:hypothetical protein